MVNTQAAAESSTTAALTNASTTVLISENQWRSQPKILDGADPNNKM
jgi:hypothetical protein